MKKVNRRRFGKNFRTLRQSRGLSQEALAERSSVSIDAIRRIEAGQISPSLDTVGRLARGLEVTLPTLFAMLESGERDPVAELTDLLSFRAPRKTRRLLRIAKALFNP